MKKIKIATLTMFVVLTSFAQLQAQTQIGADIDGSAINDNFGHCVSMPDAKTVAIGAPFYDRNQDADVGVVRIYKLRGSAWTQKGSEIVGEATNDRSGWSVSMPDSNTVAIGASYNGGTGTFAGHVRIYSWNGSAWTQKGGDIDGEAASDQSGYSVSMPDANTVAIGATANDGTASNAGHVRIYYWSGSAWIQKGSDIDGEAAGDKSGYSVSMPDANTVAIGADNNDGTAKNAGHVRIYSWSGSAWTKKGADIDGEAIYDFSGRSVCMPDANTVAIGASGNDGAGSDAGHVRIYTWSGSAWTKKGADIDGEAADDYSGWPVSMPNANTVAIGASSNGGNGSTSGHVRIYTWSGLAWTQIGVDIDGEAAGDNSGCSVSMPDSNTVAIGAIKNDGTASNAGHVRIYDITNTYNITNTYEWTGTNNLSVTTNWSSGIVPSQNDSAVVQSGTMTVNQATTLDVLTVDNGSNVKLDASLTLRNLHLKNGTIDLNGHRLTVTGGIYQTTGSTNYYIQAGTSASPKPLSELVFAPTANTSSTLYLNPNANTLKVLELGTATKTVQVTLGNTVKIKGGNKTDIGSLKINNGSKIIIPSGASLTLACDTFNSYLNLSHPAQRAIHCSGTGTFNIERQHYGARGWRIYSHPFSSDIDLVQIADDIDLIGSGGTAEGFADDVYKNTSSFWYDYSKADTTNSSVATDPAWTGFSSAKGTLISGNSNKWKKHAPIMVFNPGAVRGSGAFSSPSTATYQQGKITLSYTLDSTTVHLNDGKTQTISTADLTSAPKSRYFLLTNPFTAPVRLGRIQGLNLTNCANKFYYWNQNQASISNNFMAATWASQALFNGNATRDSNVSIPAFGTILIEMKNSASATNFTIPESAKQLSNFDYLVGGDITGSNSGVKQTLFMEIPQTYQGPGGIEVQLLMKDSVPVDGMLIYDRVGESSFFTNNDAKKFKESSFANIYSLAKGGESLSLDAQDITSRLNNGETQVEIPLVIERDFNKTQGNFRLRIWEKHSELQTYFKDAKTGQEYPAESFDNLPIAFEADETVINRYSLVFKRNSSSTEDLTEEKEALTSNSKMDIIVYPNPGKDYVSIRVTNNTQFLSYDLYASDGRVVKTGTIKNFETLDIKSLSKGIYYLNCNGNSIKIIKQ